MKTKLVKNNPKTKKIVKAMQATRNNSFTILPPVLEGASRSNNDIL